MPSAFEHCICHNGVPESSDSLQSMCWPMIQRKPPTVLQRVANSKRPRQVDVSWPVSEPWRRNLGQPRCGGEGRCQGDAQRCNSKYRYGVDDLGRCPSVSSCQSSYSCTAPCPPDCPHPCPQPSGCNRLTTRCFDWPIPRRDRCPPGDSNKDHRPPRTDLNLALNQPERCPTCKRVVVDMECGPLGYNY